MTGSEITLKSSASHRTHQSTRSAKYSNTTTSSARDQAYAAGVRDGEQRAKPRSMSGSMRSGSVSGSVRSHAVPLGNQPQGLQAMPNKAGHMGEVSNALALGQIAKDDAGSRSGCSSYAGGSPRGSHSSRRSHHGGGEIARVASLGLGNIYDTMMQDARGVTPIPTRDRPKVTNGSVRIRADQGGGLDVDFWEQQWYE